MKIAIIGGAGVRVPLLVGGLVRSDLPITDVALYDTDEARERVVADLARRLLQETDAGGPAGSHVHVHAAATPEAAIEGADFVITSIRVGGIGQRARDEATAVAHGIVGQETVGPAGFAMAVRTIPAMVHYAQLTARLAPSAWLITFTNPVSIVTQAVVQHAHTRVIGICDTPYEIFEDAAHALGLPARECAYDYFGLNHLGWLREVYHGGRPQLDRLWSDEARLQMAYRSPLFETERLRGMRLLPTEYVYYYYRSQVALDNLRRAGTSRGVVVARLTDELFADLAQGVADPVARYQQYLAARDASYMQIESGSGQPRIKPDWAELSGYDRIALMTMRGIVHDTGDVIPLDVLNRGNLPFLDDDDVIEVPCVVDRNGPRALHIPPVPEHCQDLIHRVKVYERATVAAAISGRRDDLIAALAQNPLVADAARVPALVDALMTP